MGNKIDLLGNVSATVGGYAGAGVGGVVNVANSTITGAATFVDGAMVSVGDGVGKVAGLAVTGGSSLIDILCGYIRGGIGTIGGFANNCIVEVVQVVGGKEAADCLPRDGNPKEHFGNQGAIIGAIMGDSMDGVRSSLSWPSKHVDWGGFNPFFSLEGNPIIDGLSAVAQTVTNFVPMVENIIPSSGSIASIIESVVPLSASGDNSAQSLLAPLGSLGNVLTQPVNLVTDLLGGNAAATSGVDIPVSDGLLAQTNDPLQQAANAVAVIM